MSRPEPQTRDKYRVFSTISTRWTDNDIYSHMNNAIHYQLFDTAVNKFLIEKKILDLHGGETVFLVVETGCRYFSEIAYPDTVAAGIRVAKLGTCSVRYEVGLFRNDAEKAAAEGHFIHVNVDRGNRRPLPINDAARRVLGTICISDDASAG